MKYADIMTDRDLKRYNSYIEEDLDPNTPCTHIWVGWRNEQQRGRFMLQGDRCVASRIAYGLAHPDEDLSDDIFVLHHCDRPQCVSEACLWLGTQTDNMRDASQKGRTCRGSARTNPNDPARTNLNEDLVYFARLVYKRGLMRICDIARWFKMSHPACRDMLLGINWKHVDLPED